MPLSLRQNLLRFVLALSIFVSMLFPTVAFADPIDPDPDDGAAEPFAADETDVIGGTVAQQGAWPWIVSIRTTSGFQFCGGSIIHPQWVLTAAHCVFEEDGQVSAPGSMYVVVSDYRISDANDGGQSIGVSQIIPHPSYDPSRLDNDLALLRLSAPANAAYVIELISAESIGLESTGTSVNVIGWGRTQNSSPNSASDVLMQATMPIENRATCSNYFSFYVGIGLTDNMVCAGTPNVNRNACHGDSGGPLVAFDNTTSQWRQLGIVSWGRGNCPAVHTYGVYSRVSRYLGWIAGYVPGIVRTPKLDLTGEGRADILWRHLGNGQNHAWAMNGASITGAAPIWPVTDLRWRIVGVGDFTGDGRLDLFWRHTTTGENRIWAMNGATILAEGVPWRVADLGWKVTAIADFNADRLADVLWNNPNTGQSQIWLMNGGTVVTTLNLPTLNDVNWQIKAADDLTGDRRADIVFVHRTSGGVALWSLNGNQVALSQGIFTLGDLQWQLVGTGDYTGDGLADLVWRHQGNGTTTIQAMRGASIIGQATLPQVDLSWRLAATGDYTGDKRADILWRNTSSGSNYIWAMNGGSIVASGAAPAISDQNWQIVGPGMYNGVVIAADAAPVEGAISPEQVDTSVSYDAETPLSMSHSLTMGAEVPLTTDSGDLVIGEEDTNSNDTLPPYWIYISNIMAE